jgi:pimeloyl-ACP methyl ester carboxylesterase
MWDDQVAALDSRYQMIVWDLRGHGRSDGPTDAGSYAEAQAVADILDASGVERSVIGGPSLGGYLSLAFYRVHPDRTRALILCDCGPGTRNPARLASASYEEAVYVPWDEAEPAGTDSHPRGRLTQVDARRLSLLLAVIDVPTLVVIGADDFAYRAAAEDMAERIPGAAFVRLEGAGHLSNLDQPASFNHAIDSFLSSLPS